MGKPFIIVTDGYSSVRKSGVNLVAGAFAARMGYTVLPVITCDEASDALLNESTVIAIGSVNTHPILKSYAQRGVIDVPDTAEGYSVFVGKDVFIPDKDVVLIAGSDDAGVLYGCADFCNKYFAVLAGQGAYYRDVFVERILEEGLPPFSISTAPKIPTRAIWSWGHMIYDYRAFFKNMARLRLNEVVIWNDRCPINARDVVEYAHSYGIRVVWGYAWGWDQSGTLEKTVSESDEAMLSGIKEKAIRTYEQEYAGVGDGIYFQSFTEITKESVDGKSVADLVVGLVNETAAELLSRYPELHIQFGLHATSVKTKTDIIAGVDPRVYIVWEDCGAFPYSYGSDSVEGFDETLRFTEKILTLRGREERFGAVLKGQVCLDWLSFKHFSHPYVMGEYPQDFVTKRTKEKKLSWKTVTAGWLRNAEYARKIAALVAEWGSAPILEMLVEDGCFEGEIALPTALMAEFFWNADEEVAAVIERVSKYPCVSI